MPVNTWHAAGRDHVHVLHSSNPKGLRPARAIPPVPGAELWYGTYDAAVKTKGTIDVGRTKGAVGAKGVKN